MKYTELTKEQLEFYLCLYFTKGIGKAKIRKLMQDFPLCFDEYSVCDTLKIDYKSSGFSSQQIKNKVRDIIDFCDHSNIHILPQCSRNFPKALRLSSSSPAFIFCQGNISLLNQRKAVAVIGTRSPTAIGIEVANRVSAFLSEAGFIVISGLAKGIDTAAHLGTLKKSASTIAILASIDRITPVENTKLLQEILDQNGLAFSEYPPLTMLTKNHFIERDHLQSAMSLAVFPIEAGMNSGTRHAVEKAFQEHKRIYCPNTSRLCYAEGTEQIEGIKDFVKRFSAIEFTKDDYGTIISYLNSINTDHSYDELEME